MDGLSPAFEVREAVYSLESLMYRAQRKQNKVLPLWEGVEPGELASRMKQLESGIHCAGDLLQNPPPGRGLDSLFVRAVASRYARFEEWKLSLRNGWGDALRQEGSGDLNWLASKAPMLGTELNGWALRGPSGVARLLEPKKRALDRLWEKSAEWTSAFADAPDEPQGAMVKRELLSGWEPWKQKRSDFAKACGRLLLEAIDLCEVSTDRMSNVGFAETAMASLADCGVRLLDDLCGTPLEPAEVARLPELLSDASSQALELRAGGNLFIERLLADPEDAELTGRELARLKAYLKQPVSLAAFQREQQTTGGSKATSHRSKLKLIRDFNVELQASLVSSGEKVNGAERLLAGSDDDLLAGNVSVAPHVARSGSATTTQEPTEIIQVWKQSLNRQREAFTTLSQADSVLAVQAVWCPVHHEAELSPKAQVFKAKSERLEVVGSCGFVAQNSGLPVANGTVPEGSILLQYLSAKADPQDQEKLLAWRAIAEKSAFAVAGAPVATLRGIGFSHLPKDADDWTYLIFLLAWQKRRGWTLKANQTAESPAGTTTSRKLGGQYSLWKMLWGDDIEAMRRTPWFSFLPDLTEASIEAIDLVISMLRLPPDEIAGKPTSAISWEAYPLKSYSEIYPDFPRGTYSGDPFIIEQVLTPAPIPTYVPDEGELCIVRKHFPHADPANPPWKDIQAQLIAAGLLLDTLKKLQAGDLLRVWVERTKPPAATILVEQPAGGDAGAGDGETLTTESVEKRTPPLDKRNSKLWAKAGKLKQHKEAAATKSLREQRSRGKKNVESSFGVCEVGRIWRKDGRDTWYYVPSLVPLRDLNQALIADALRLLSTVD